LTASIKGPAAYDTTPWSGLVTEDMTPWSGLFDLDAVTPITGVHLGIVYLGEVVRAERWSPSLGQRPERVSHFKIVLLQQRPKLGLPTVTDSNVAVCAQAESSVRQAHPIISEITATKEAAYLTRREHNYAAAINSALKERQDDLTAQLVARESSGSSRVIFLS
jgi:hypothetical protein